MKGEAKGDLLTLFIVTAAASMLTSSILAFLGFPAWIRAVECVLVGAFIGLYWPRRRR